MFEDFYNHPFIKSIADKERWTVVDKNKRPIDMYGLIYMHKIFGAAFCDEKSLVSLKTLCETLPNATNNTFYMDALTDGFVVLDIEPKCPQNIKNKLLQLPYIYGELSLSGKGYHLIFPLPDCIENYPIAKKKVTMKEEHGYYEILLNHYVTFTRNIIPKSKGASDFEKIFKELASQQKEHTKNNIEIEEEEPDDIPLKDTILTIMYNQAYRKQPKDFDFDMSKYEYGYISFLYEKLLCVLALSNIKSVHEYSDTEKAWLLYNAAKEMLPYREKHDEMRTGLPWLMYLSQEVIAKNTRPKSK